MELHCPRVLIYTVLATVLQESLANYLRFTKLKPSKVVVTISNPLADLLIHQTFFRQTFEKSKLAKQT